MITEQAEPTQPQALNEMIDRYWALYQERKELSAEVKDLGEKLTVLERELIQRMDEVGTDQSRSNVASVSISSEVIPDVEDWDAFYSYIQENTAFYLLQRRPTAKAFQELREAGEEIPGVRPFTKRSISIRRR